MDSLRETQPDGTLILDTAVTLPAVLDVLVVGGGPFGTAVAFRAKELGLSALVIDYDDLMKRIRDYAKDKQILPDYGGGDRMRFPKGGALISKLHFPPIDKDAMCREWKALYRRHSVPAQIGVELTALERDGDQWRAVAWNHLLKSEQALRARHVVLALGRGVPRRLDIPGDVAGLAFGLTDAQTYVGQPACVIGGGTSAAEAVIAISNAKAAGGNPSAVYWSYRGDKMPKVSKALADVFFEAFMGHGNIRYLPGSEPVSMVNADGDVCLSLRTARVSAQSRPTETTHFEFAKRFCIACIGEDIPEALLARLGVPLVTGGPANKSRPVVTPLLETRQANVHLAGDVLSPAYFETTDFASDPSQFGEIKRRGNIKAALRDGVLVAEVIAQKLAGRVKIEVKLDFAEELAPAPVVPAPAPGPPEPAAPPTRVLGACSLVSILPSGVEANEFALKRDGVTTIGRRGADVEFADDSALADIHATILFEEGSYRVRGEGKDRTVQLQPAPDRSIDLERGAVIRAGRQWLVVGDRQRIEVVGHFDRSGKRLATFELREGSTVIGRQAPDVTIAPEDGSLSRRHFVLTLKAGRVSMKDLGSANGTQLVVTAPVRLVDGDRILVGSQVLAFRDERVMRTPSPRISFETQIGPAPASGPPRAAVPASGSKLPGAMPPPEAPQAAPSARRLACSSKASTASCRPRKVRRSAK